MATKRKEKQWYIRDIFWMRHSYRYFCELWDKAVFEHNEIKLNIPEEVKPKLTGDVFTQEVIVTDKGKINEVKKALETKSTAFKDVKASEDKPTDKEVLKLWFKE